MLISEGKTNKFGETAKAGGHRGRGDPGRTASDLTSSAQVMSPTADMAHFPLERTLVSTVWGDQFVRSLWPCPPSRVGRPYTYPRFRMREVLFLAMSQLQPGGDGGSCHGGSGRGQFSIQ